MNELTHVNQQGRARMVDVSNKGETARIAVARGEVLMKRETLSLVRDGGIVKGDVLAVAQVAGIMGAKKTPDLIPMCHPLFLSGIDMSFFINDEENKVEIEAAVKLSGKTGVEMEALTAVSIAALTVYDMCKAVDKDMVIQNIRLAFKSGGKSGGFIRSGERPWKE